MCHSDPQVHICYNLEDKTQLNKINKVKSILLSHCLDVFGLALRELTPAADGNAVLVSWSWSRRKQWLIFGEELLYYVIEWMSIPAADLHWQKTGQRSKQHLYHRYKTTNVYTEIHKR